MLKKIVLSAVRAELTDVETKLTPMAVSHCGSSESTSLERRVYQCERILDNDLYIYYPNEAVSGSASLKKTITSCFPAYQNQVNHFRTTFDEDISREILSTRFGTSDINEIEEVFHFLGSCHYN